MTSTAIDTSVLIAIAKGEDEAERWVDVLARAGDEGDLVICDVVAAEYFALLMDDEKFEATLRGLGIGFSPIRIESARHAGRIFRRYRNRGGPRANLVPDFLIGAHAIEQADRLAAVDRGYLRRYFPKLRILRPRAR